MSEPYTDYGRGMQKLFGLFDPGPAPDLRTDPAFAWRVLMAFKQAGLVRNTANPEVGWHFVSSNVQTPEFWYADAADALYAAVCELGRQP